MVGRSKRRRRRSPAEAAAEDPAEAAAEEAEAAADGKGHRPLNPRPKVKQWGTHSWGVGHGDSQRRLPATGERGHNGRERKGTDTGGELDGGEDSDGGELERNGAGGEDSDGALGDAEPLLQQQHPRTRREGARRVEDQNREANFHKGCFASLFAMLTTAMVAVAARVVGASADLACAGAGAGAGAGSGAASFKCGVCLSECMLTHSISCEECNAMMCEKCDLSQHPVLHTHSRWFHSAKAGRRGLDAEEFSIQG
jgi:hypothetical protein